MTETIISVSSDSHSMKLPVTVIGDTIMVSSGSVTFDNVQYVLQEDETYTVTPRQVVTNVSAYLVLDITKEPFMLRVFVDESLEDGVDVPYTFESEGDYQLLSFLYVIKVPAQATDLSKLNITRWIVE